MKFNVYSVYDCKVKEFSEPFIQRDGAVERSLAAMLKTSPIPREDLSLFLIGTWNSETGDLDSYEKPIFVKTDLLPSGIPADAVLGKGVV